MPEVLHAVCFFWWILMELVLLGSHCDLDILNVVLDIIAAPLSSMSFSCYSTHADTSSLLCPPTITLSSPPVSLSVALLPPAAATAACVVTGQSEFFCKPPSNWLKNKERQGNAGLFWQLGASKTPRGCKCVCVSVCEKESWEETVEIKIFLKQMVA